MEVALRLKRMGTNKKPFFRIVAVTKARKRDGKVIDELGYYDPKKKDSRLSIDMKKVDYWIKNGAKPSATVHSFIKKNKQITA